MSRVSRCLTFRYAKQTPQRESVYSPTCPHGCDARDAADIDYARVARSLQHWVGQPHKGKARLQVGRHDLVPLVVGVLHSGLADVCANIVNQSGSIAK